MSFTDLERKRIEKALDAFLEKRRPPVHIRPQLDLGYRITEQSVELFEIRPQWNDPSKIHEHSFAKATFVKARKIWKIFWMRANLKWYPYEPNPITASIEDFLAIVDADKHGCFFG